MALVFFYPQLKKLTGAERLILKLASYTARRLEGRDQVVLLTHHIAKECLPALSDGVGLIESRMPLQLTGNHYVDAAVEYALSPALVLGIPRKRLSGVVFFGPPSVPAMWFARWIWLPLLRKRMPVLYFCFEPPRFIYSDTGDIVSRLGMLGRLISPAFRVYRRLDQAMVCSAHHVLSNSPYGSRRIWNAYRRKAVVIEHGMDFRKPDAATIERLRARYDLQDKPVVVTVNHLHPRKRIDLFIRGVHHAAKRVPGTVALVVGGGPERESLEGLAASLGMVVGRDVVFTGAVPEEELPAHYALGNVYMHTGREESFGLSVIEALGLGLPVVSVDEGGPCDTVQHGRSGYLVPATPEALGSAAADLLSDLEKAMSMGRAGSDFVHRQFQWEKGAATLLKVLRHAAGRLESQTGT
ncbi:MAG: phosphatidyl-myo-inositol dimannoside synthase [Chloroflexia bacterium]|nr:phosphatidyl-myo-inositol dimannoside synthase [Chloroflexia bacterium]